MKKYPNFITVAVLLFQVSFVGASVARSEVDSSVVLACESCGKGK